MTDLSIVVIVAVAITTIAIATCLGLGIFRGGRGGGRDITSFLGRRGESHSSCCCTISHLFATSSFCLLGCYYSIYSCFSIVCLLDVWCLDQVWMLETERTAEDCKWSIRPSLVQFSGFG